MTSATLAPMRSSPGFGPSSRKSRASRFSCRSPKTSMSVAASAEPNSNSRFRMPGSTSSITGRQITWRCRRALCCAMWQRTSRSPAPRLPSRSIEMPPIVSASRPRPSTRRFTTPSASARSLNISCSSTIIGSCSRSIHASSSIRTRSISSMSRQTRAGRCRSAPWFGRREPCGRSRSTIKASSRPSPCRSISLPASRSARPSRPSRGSSRISMCRRRSPPRSRKCAGLSGLAQIHALSRPCGAHRDLHHSRHPL